MTIARKIDTLVKKGYKEAAFSRKENAVIFGKALVKKGLRVEVIRSSGPTVEGKRVYRRRGGNAYYVIGSRKK